MPQDMPKLQGYFERLSKVGARMSKTDIIQFLVTKQAEKVSMNELVRETGRQYKTLYSSLYRLWKNGYLRPESGRGLGRGAGRAPSVYIITEKGKTYLRFLANNANNGMV